MPSKNFLESVPVLDQTGDDLDITLGQAPLGLLHQSGGDAAAAPPRSHRQPIDPSLAPIVCGEDRADDLSLVFGHQKNGGGAIQLTGDPRPGVPAGRFIRQSCPFPQGYHRIVVRYPERSDVNRLYHFYIVQINPQFSKRFFVFGDTGNIEKARRLRIRRASVAAQGPFTVSQSSESTDPTGGSRCQ